MNLDNLKLTGVDEIHITDSLNSALLGLKITVDDNTIIPDSNELYIYVDKASKSNPTENKKTYVYNLLNSLKNVGVTSDEFILELAIEDNDAIIQTKVSRKIGISATEGNYVLDSVLNEEIESYPLTLFDGENYIYTNYNNARIEVIYPKDTEFNRLFLNNASYYEHKLKRLGELSMDDIYFKDAFTKTENKLNLEVNNINADCITSRNNKFSLDEEGNLTVNSITSKVQTNIAGEVVLEEDAATIEITNLDALNDGGVYEFIALGYTNSTTSTDIKVKINNLTSGYHHSYINASGSLSASGALTSRANYAQNVDDINEYLQTNGPNNAFPVVIEGRLYISENSSGQKKVNYTLRHFRTVSNGQSICIVGGVFSQNFDNIYSLSLSLVNGSINFTKGSRLTVFCPLRGAKGEKGEKGDIGLSNTLTIGTVTNGNEASATLTGESPNQVLNLVLPRGEKGDNGGTMTVTDVQNMITERMGTLYPVGSIYMSVASTNPSTLFGGTWEQLKDRFLLGAGDTYTSGTTGGSALLQAHTHNIPSLSGTAESNGGHTHVTSRRTSTYGSGMQSNWRCITAPGSANGDYNQVSNTESAGSHTHNITTNASTSGITGTGDAENMPPYLTVYMWKRVQ